MSAIPVPTVNINALYTNTTSGTDADPQVMDNAIIDIVSTINANATEQNNNTAAAVLPHADGSVTTAKLADLGTTTAKLNDLAVTTGKIAASAVTTAKIADSNVTLAKMADASVGTAELVDLSVTTAKIAIGAVGVAQLSPAAAVNETVNNALIVALDADVVQRAINIKYPPSPLVGCKCDNSTDDTAAFQAIIDAYTNVNLILPYGTTTLVSDKLNFTNKTGVTIFGYGAILKLKDNSLGASSLKPLLYFKTSSNINVFGLEMDGNRLNQGATYSEFNFCIQLFTATNVKIIDCILHDMAGDAIYIGDSSLYVIVDNCTIYNPKPSSGGSGARQGIAITNAQRVWITRNKLTGTTFLTGCMAFDIEPNLSPETVSNVWIEGNFVDTAWNRAISLNSTTSGIFGNLYIRGNRFKRGLVITPPSGSIAYMDISNNDMDEGIIISKCVYFNFSQNKVNGKQVDNFASAHMQLTDVGFANIVNNQFRSVNETLTSSISILGSTTGVITNNSIYGNPNAITNGIIMASSGGNYPADVTISSNQFRSLTKGINLDTMIVGQGITLGVNQYVSVTTNVSTVSRLENPYSGSTANRPATNLFTGQTYLDTTIRRLIVWDGAKWQNDAMSAVPTTGTWAVGDIVYNTAPASAGFIGWVCTVAGTPGTWKTFGLIS